MQVFLFVLCVCSVSTTFAWLAPERCQQSGNSPTPYNTTVPSVQVDPQNVKFDPKKAAEKQNDNLKEMYKSHRFVSVPIKGVRTHPFVINVFAPHNCKFRTRDPSILASIACYGANCQLSHSVSTVDTYTANEGYNWGVKISTKVNIIPAIWEVGGEVSAGGTYSCTYTKGRTTTESVSCSVPNGQFGGLQLYLVKSDMVCEMGNIKMVRQMRKDERYGDVQRISEKNDGITFEDVKEIERSANIKINVNFYMSDILVSAFMQPNCLARSEYMIDMSKISNRLLSKMLKLFPYFDPLRDIVCIPPTDKPLDEIPSALQLVTVLYYKLTPGENDYKITVPFTKENGDSVYHYACIITPLDAPPSSNATSTRM